MIICEEWKCYFEFYENWFWIVRFKNIFFCCNHIFLSFLFAEAIDTSVHTVWDVVWLRSMSLLILYNVRGKKHSLLERWQQALMLVQWKALQSTTTQWVWLLCSTYFRRSDRSFQALCLCCQVQQSDVHTGHTKAWREKVSVGLSFSLKD